MRARGIGAILHLLALLFRGIELFLYLVGGLASLVSSAGSGGRSQQLQVQGFDDVHPTRVPTAEEVPMVGPSEDVEVASRAYFHTLSSNYIIVVHITASAEPQFFRR